MNNLKNTWHKLKPFYGPFRSVFVSVFLLLAVVQLLLLASPYLWGKIIDGIIKGRPLYQVLALAGAVFVISIIGNQIARAREIFERKHFDHSFTPHVAKYMLTQLFGFSLGQYLQRNSGMSLSVINKGENAFESIANSLAWQLAPVTLQITLTSIAIFFLSPPIGAIITLGLGVYIILLVRYTNNFFPQLKALEEKNNVRSKFHAEMIRYASLIKTHAQEKRVLDHYMKKVEETSILAQSLWIRYLRAWYSRNTIIITTQFLSLAMAIYLVSRGYYTPGTIVTIIGWSNAVFSQIGVIGNAQRTILKNSPFIANHIDLVNTKPTIVPQEHGVTLPYLTGKIEFRNVSFAYPKQEGVQEDGSAVDENKHEVLSNVSFTIEPGETCAFVGHSGSGKTTIVNLLLRAFDPDHGSILIDGHDLRTLDLTTYRRMIGLVEQSVELFDETLRYNILFGVSEEKQGNMDALLDEVARKARIDQFYDRLGPEKFDTIIGEKGVRLSGGERQRVGIARALFKDPHILIFDEATSSLDSVNEAAIHEAMNDALKNRTGIIIAHRLSTVKDASKIIVMKSGQVVGIGTHDKLKQTCKPYQELVEHQVVTL